MLSYLSSAILVIVLVARLQLVVALNASCAPGGNFDLSIWALQLPIGTTHEPDTISASQLEGCAGFTNLNYFFTESGDGALVMKCPSKNCVTTPNSAHCRTELRETSPASWDPNDPVNRLSATLAVMDAGGSTCIGQIHIEDTISVRPVAELYCNSDGNITMGVEQTRAGGNEVSFHIGNIPLGETFSYEIRYEGNVLSVSLNDGALVVMPTYQLDAPASYFKAGNYLQGTSPSEVHFFAINVTHSTTTVTPTSSPACAIQTAQMSVGAVVRGSSTLPTFGMKC